MGASSAGFDRSGTLAALDAAVSQKLITASAAANIRDWLVEPRYAEYRPAVAEHIADGKWKKLDDVFWTIIPFGTGGRRGKMYPIGSNAINDRTIGESAQGLADYVKRIRPRRQALGCAIAYDTRHRSRHFAELCAEVMVAAGFKVYFLDGFRSTPELSFAVRYKHCSCGIMVTASHNPPSDNAVKAYWSTGGQLLPPHDQGVIDRVMAVQRNRPRAVCRRRGRRACRALPGRGRRGIRAGRVTNSISRPAALKIIYSPLHGVGASAVCRPWRPTAFATSSCSAPTPSPTATFPMCRATSRIRKTRPCSTHHRAGQRGRRRSDPGHAIPTATGWAGGTGNHQGRVRLGHDHRQPDRRPAEPSTCSSAERKPAG